MLGFLAKASTTDIALVDGELEAAKWWDMEDVKKALNGNLEVGEEGASLRLPPKYAIAHGLLRAWCDGWGCGVAKI